MAVSNQEINTWLQANAGATDADIAAAMNQYGVSTGQMAQATGLDQGAVQSRYDAASIANTPGMGTQGIGMNFSGQTLAPDYAALAGFPAQQGTSSSNAVYLQSKLDQLASDPAAAQQAKDLGWTGGDVGALESFLASRGLTPEQHYQQFGVKEGLTFPTKPLYERLTATSSPEEIAEAYSQFSSGIGGDTTQNQEEAEAFLRRIGVAEPLITQAYQKYADVSGLKPSFGSGDAPTTEGILSGFKYATQKGLSEDQMKKTLGEDTFNTYKAGFADYAKTGIANILADKKLSFDEAREAVKFGREYGYDSQKLAELTGQKKELFDTINKSYDDTTNKLVDSVLGAEDVKTDGDKIGRALALQQKYGFTDEDLAKATDLSLDQVKDYLNPVRNFESDYKKLLEDPNRNEDKTKEFLTASMQNPLLREKFGDKFQPALDELNRPPRERLLDQIGAQQNALGGKYYQGVFSDPKTMVEVLERKGVKSLADLGQKEKFQEAPARVQYITSDGIPLTEFEDGSLGYSSESDGQWKMVPKDQAQATYSTRDDDGLFGGSRPLSEEEMATLKDGKFQKNIGNVVINKRTGEEITDTTRQLAYQKSSGGLKEKKNWLTVEFDKGGNPVLVASKAKAGLGAALQEAMPMIAMALPFVLPGLGAGLSAMLPGAAVAATGAAAAIPATLMNQALTQGIIGGGLSTLGGGQFEKGFLGGAISPVISSGIGSLLPAGLDANATRAITGAGTGVIKGALQGGNFEDLLQQGVLSGMTNYGLGEATKGLNLTPQQLNFATGIAAPLLQGQKVSPIKALSALAQAGQQAQKARP